MRIIDEKGRIFKIINIIDLCVLVVLLLFLSVVGYKVLGNKITSSTSTKDVIITVKCRQTMDSASKSLKKGDRIIAGTAYVNASIDSVSVKNADYVTTTVDGDPKLTTHPLLKDIFVTIKAKMDTSTPALKLGTLEVGVGKDFLVKTHITEIKGSVDSIQIQ